MEHRSSRAVRGCCGGTDLKSEEEHRPFHIEIIDDYALKPAPVGKLADVIQMRTNTASGARW